MQEIRVMKDICLCILKETDMIHSIGINDNNGRYYSEEGGGSFDLKKNNELFRYVEKTWREFRKLINNACASTLIS